MSSPAEPAAEPAADALSDAEAARREKLKRAGEEYFARVLAQTSRSKQPSGSLPAAKQAPLSTREPIEDDTFATVGHVVESSKLYVLGTVYVAGQSASLVFAKSSLTALAAPAVLVFLHFLPLVCAIWLMSVQGVLSLRPFSSEVVQGSLPAAVTTGTQALLLFSALLHSSVPAVLCWVTVVPHLVNAALDMQLNKTQILPARLGALGAGVLATGAALFSGELPGAVGFTSLLLWAAIEAASQLWAACRQRPHLLVQALGDQRGEALQRLVEAEAAVDGATLAFMRHALPALPVLVIGLVLGEGSELVEHELSVPAVTMILVSVAAWGLSAISLLLISDSLAKHALAALNSAGPLGAVVVEAAVHGVGSPLAFCAAVVTVVAGMVLRMAAAAAAM